jgi:hypothetical protein
VLLQAEEILNATIAELTNLGLPHEKKEKEKIWELLEDDLTGKDLKKLEILIKSDDSDRNEKITSILEELGKERLSSIILKLLTD